MYNKLNRKFDTHRR